MKNIISEKIKIWKKADGTFYVTKFVVSERGAFETEESYIERMTEREKKQHPELCDLIEIDSTKTKFKNAVEQSIGKTRRKLRVSANGCFFYDETIKTPKEKKDELNDKTFSDLKKVGLSDDVIKNIMRKE